MFTAQTQSLWVPVGRAPRPSQPGRALPPREGCFGARILWSGSPHFPAPATLRHALLGRSFLLGYPRTPEFWGHPAPPAISGPGAFTWGAPTWSRAVRGFRLRTAVRVGRARQAPQVLWAVCNLLSLEAGFHPGDISIARTLGPRGAPANTQPTAGPAPTSQQGPVFSFARSSPNFQALLRSEAAEHT